MGKRRAHTPLEEKRETGNPERAVHPIEREESEAALRRHELKGIHLCWRKVSALYFNSRVIPGQRMNRGCHDVTMASKHCVMEEQEKKLT